MQTAEQLVEVLTIVSYSSLHGLVERNVGIPVPHGRGGGGGPQYLRPGQNSAASSSHSPGAADGVLQGFSHFCPDGKTSARLGPRSGSELAADFTPWTPAACGVSMVPEEDEPEPVLVAEFEEQDLDKWVGEFGRRWFRSEVYPGR